jgi:Type II secretion system protein C
MRKPVYLAVVGISIVVAGASLGILLTRYLGLLAYSPKGAAQAASAPAVPGNPATPPTEWNNLFAPRDGMTLASRLPAMDGKSASQAPRSAFVLVGTIVSSSPAARRAILWADGMKEAKAFRVKEEIEPGAILAAVERDKVWIARGKEREKLEILPVGSRGRPAATPRPAVASSPAAAPAVASGAPTRFVPEQPSPGGTQALGSPNASRLDADGESSASIQDRIRRLRGNRR